MASVTSTAPKRCSSGWGIDMLTFNELISSISTEFLTRPFPSNHGDWGIDAIIDFVEDHKIEQFELLDSESIFMLISGIAHTVAHDQFGGIDE